MKNDLCNLCILSLWSVCEHKIQQRFVKRLDAPDPLVFSAIISVRIAFIITETCENERVPGVNHPCRAGVGMYEHDVPGLQLRSVFDAFEPL